MSRTWFEPAPVIPRDDVLCPRQFVRFHGLGEADGGFDGEAAEVVAGERHVRADHTAPHGQELAEVGEALVAQLAIRPARTFAVADQRGLQVHLKEGEALFLTQRHAPFVRLDVGGAGGIAVDADAVALLFAQQLPQRDTQHLAANIVECDVDGAVTATGAAMSGKRPDATQDLLRAHRVLAEKHALEDQRVVLATGIADFAETVDALVGVDADDGVVVVSGNRQSTHVGDLEIAGGRVGIDGAGRLLGLALCIQGGSGELENAGERGGIDGLPEDLAAADDTHGASPWLRNRTLLSENSRVREGVGHPASQEAGFSDHTGEPASRWSFAGKPGR
ncbi:MAG: hypothetical protein NTW28_23290 [Candidatus Solibacter sp.]|nr:hypothetical protein [Candidatus Solibacter sp.]